MSQAKLYSSAALPNESDPESGEEDLKDKNEEEDEDEELWVLLTTACWVNSTNVNLVLWLRAYKIIALTSRTYVHASYTKHVLR